MKALGVREGAGDVQRDWGGPGPGSGRHSGECWGWTGQADRPEGFGSGGHSLWACIK